MLYYEVHKTDIKPYLVFIPANVTEKIYIENTHILYKLEKEPIKIYGISEYDLIDNKLVKRDPGQFTETIKEEYYTSMLNRNIDSLGSETGNIIYEGFEFDNNIFSLSINAQTNWNRFLLLHQNNLFVDTEISTFDSKRYILTKDKLVAFIAKYNDAINNALKEHRNKLDKLKADKYKISINL